MPPVIGWVNYYPGYGIVAGDVTDDTGVAAVEYYRDDGDGQFDPGTDSLVYTDTNGADGWRSTPTLHTGTYFVQAVDVDGAWSETYFSVQVGPPALEVLGPSGYVIPIGAQPPSADGTGFGIVDVGSTDTVYTYALHNVGHSTLSITSAPYFTGSAAGDFSVEGLGQDSVDAFGYGSFTVRFHPSASGVRTATLHIPSDDPDHPVYDFTVAGFAVNARPDGLRYAVQTPGSGTAAESGFLVAVHYIGTVLGSSTPFDSSEGRGAFTFYLGHNEVIAGWESGLAGVRPGEFITLVVPPGLGYGAIPRSGIPANSTLVFDIEVLAVEPPDIDVAYNGQSLVAGQSAVSVADGTDFGAYSLATGPITRTFTVRNVGDGSLDWASPTLTVTGAHPGDFAISPITRSGTDSASGSFTVTFFPSAGGPRSAVITIASNDPDEPAFSFTVAGTTAAPAPPLPFVSLIAPIVRENAGTAVFTITLSAPSDTPITVAVATRPGTAVAGKDYTHVAQSVTFPPGVTTREVSVPLFGDTVIEPDKSFDLDLLQVTGPAVLAADHATATILDDDGADLVPSFSLKLPAPIVAGTVARPVVRLTNAGNFPAKGTVIVRFYASSDPGYDPSDRSLGSAVVKLNLKPKGSVKVTVPITLPAGQYHLIARVDEKDAVREFDEVNNFAITTGQINVVRKTLDVAASFGTRPISGNRARATFAGAIINTGTVAANGTGTLRFYASVDEHFSPATDILLGTVSAKYALAPGRTARFSKAGPLPASLRTGVYHLFVVLTPGSADANRANNTLMLPSTFSLS